MFEKVLLSIDQSPDSAKAVALACELAKVYGSQVLVVHGRDVPVVNPNPRPVAARVEHWETQDDAQQLVDTVVAELQGAGVHVRGQVLPGQGHIGNKILKVADDEGADLIILGSRGMSRLEEVMIGSVSHKIVHAATCPVVLAR